ncbi:MAG: TonB-dependent receptor [Tannerellaceae bacterium]|jgi:outer membrane receptor protein involved in Fe transport|nr:TonB-dependent receptor [Tannerellaceae bacterium]
MNLFYSAACATAVSFFAQIVRAGSPEPVDTTKTYLLGEVVVTSSAKETNQLRTLPGSVSLLTPQMLSAGRIEAIRSISSLVPNLYIPDYGARLTSAIYLRGVGARSSGQSVGLYVDNIPYPDKSTFDFELTDIQRIEALRGPQGTLYGRNAMGGIINIYTLSPFDFQGTRLLLSAGNYGQRKVKASHYLLWRETLALSLGGYYGRSDGYFVNQLTGRKADPEESAGGRLRLEWKPLRSLAATYTLAFDYVTQGAFPYGLYHKDTGRTDPVCIGDSSSYRRNMLTHTLLLEYRADRFLLSSATGYQQFSDRMQMDQDFSPLTLFTLRQQQRQQAVSQEWAIRSRTESPYQWSFGLYGFWNNLHADAPVTFREDGVRTILRKVFDDLREQNPRMPHLLVLDNQLYIPGTFRTPSRGGALFHQSTYNDILPGLSLTAGLRLDYETQRLSYRSTAKMRMGIAVNNIVAEIPGIAPSEIEAEDRQDFFQWLPKLSLRYAFTPRTFTYLSAAKGYKAGGYNIQMSADVMQSRMQYDMMHQFVPSLAVLPEPAEKLMAYRPEYSWNYEAGLRSERPSWGLAGELTIFYTALRDVQITRFVESGSGRILSNAGRARSMGVEATLRTQFSAGLSAHLNYGYTHAVSLYDRTYLPYIPSHTLHIGMQYAHLFRRAWVDGFTLSTQLSGIGPIRWTEENDILQSFYALLNIKTGIRKGPFSVDVWARNLTNTSYAAFYFESFNRPYVQKGKPFQAGVDLSVVF